MDEGRNMLLMFPTLIHFKNVKEKMNFRPRYVRYSPMSRMVLYQPCARILDAEIFVRVISCHIFYSRRAIDVPDGIPKWEAHKDKSKQIPETFSDAKNESGKL